MLSPFSFATATQIEFGSGSIAKAGQIIDRLGQRPLLVRGRSSERIAPLVDQLDHVKLDHFEIATEPTIEEINSGVDLAKAHQADLIVAMGGGSVIDAGKAIAALVTNPGHPLDYLEVIGAGKPLQNEPLPFVAIPTTAGTGAEVTKNAVLTSPQHRRKVSLRSREMFPTVALIDPALTLSLPPHLTAMTGLDALTQCIEPYLSCLANPLTDALAMAGIQRAASTLRRAVHLGDDLEAREGMAFASLMGGLALANAKLGAVHGFAGVLGGQLGAPHGAICGRLLPAVWRANVAALYARDPGSRTLDRFKQVAVWLTNDPTAKIEDGIEWLADLVAELEVPDLGTYGLTDEMVPEMVEKSKGSSSMKGNPIGLSDSELAQILKDTI